MTAALLTHALQAHRGHAALIERAPDSVVHDWYRFVLAFPASLVREYLERFIVQADEVVLDPFCGTGTTLVECQKHGIRAVGIEANHITYFASKVKVDWSPTSSGLLRYAYRIGKDALHQLEQDGIDDVPTTTPHELGSPTRVGARLRTLPQEAARLLVGDSISPLPLHKTLVLLGCIEQHRSSRYYHHARLALASALTRSISNLQYGPEVGVGQIKTDAPVVASWLQIIQNMALDLNSMGTERRSSVIQASVIHGDARRVSHLLEAGSISAVITSPPYPNEKDYTRTTRLESVLLGFLGDRADLREVKQGLLRSNTRNVYRGDDDDTWVAEHPQIQQLANTIEARRIELGKTSGFERLYSRVTKLYLGGMARHLSDLQPILRPGAQLAYVVGDQASYLRVLFRTGELLADIAKTLGYEVLGIELVRTRFSTVTRQELREEVLLLRWPGAPNGT